jgi:glycosyltransferase involved in cell wall biosynthesis
MSSSIAEVSQARPIWLFLDSSKFGGIESHVEVLAQALKRKGMAARVVFWGSSPPSALCDGLAAAGVPFELLNGSFTRLLSLLRKERPLLLHTHGYKANLLGRIAARLMRTPAIASYHAGFREPFPVGLYQRLDEATSFLGGRIAVSEAIRASLPYSAHLIENFVSEVAAPKHEALPRAVAFVGRLTEEKGIDLFCDIAARCGACAEWHVYGDGPMRAPLEAQYGSHVRFHGFVGDKQRIWQNSGLLLMPSCAEGLPMAAIEAAIHGVPVAASAVGGIPKIVVPGLSGWLFPSGDVAAACQAVFSWAALSPDAQRHIIESSHALAITQYSAKKGVARMLEAYRQLVPQAGGDIPRE